MGYTKTTWTSTTTITKELLNKAETQFDEAYSIFSTHNHDTIFYKQSESDSIFWHSGNDGHGSGCDADALYHPSGNKHAIDMLGGQVPSGLIIMWSGSSIPSGWALCDGSYGTPDLRGRFVLGAGGEVQPGATGRPTPAGTQLYQIKPTATSVTIGNHSLTAAEIAHSHQYLDVCCATYSFGSGGTSSKSASQASSVRTTGWSCGNASGGADPHTHSASFEGADCDVRPPYYKLAYIMKL